MRNDGGKLYWNYNVTSSIDSWEVWLYCGKSMEETDITLDFKNADKESIAKIIIEYEENGSTSAGYKPSMYCWDKSSPESLGELLGSDLLDGFYRLQIISNTLTGESECYLYSDDEQECNNMVTLDQSFSGLNRIEWSSSKNAVVCPMFFWDDHIIELSG
jgi:hypothetical protein